ncbi:MAG: glutamate--tRNA ligase [candidate division Zixibacteria bacterium]|nr:glutamate--tRNA ligase [candidate division Zixibacteria bacterium]
MRVRIAPSPTGYLHVGTARTAIANYLFARHYGGKFLLRIEDTDIERSRPELIEPILDALKWLKLDWDEDILYQSKRIETYKKYVQQLLDSGHAYRSYVTPEELDAAREKAREEKRSFSFREALVPLSEEEIKMRKDTGMGYAVRLRIPEGETVFDDIVSGRLEKKNEDIEELIIARSDGTPTYNLAVVVDDHEMGITHIIRGNDHITNTFKQIHIYQALGWELPEFGHVPLILRPDKRKVSKRLGDKDVGQYQHEGILPETMFNFLCLLGWSPKTDREIYTREELVELFDKNYFNRANAVFDDEKLLAFNHAHIQMKSDHELAVLVAPLLVEAGLTTKYWLETRWEYLRKVITVLKERAKRISDFVEMGGYFFSFDYKYDDKAEKKQFTPEAAELLTELAGRFEKLDRFDKVAIETALTALAGEKEISKARFIHPTRLAVSGVAAGPGLYDLLETLTQPVAVERMKKAAEYIRSRAQ